ncbi:MAG: NADP-dependent oxidoreductase [Deltaproteobacteria bacterium]|nr:NADP-dependent oxidoreductase [Deltaproteobacteria bacterium]
MTSTMRQIELVSIGAPEGSFRERTVNAPEPGPGQLRIAVRAAGFNPVDAKVRRGFVESALPTVLGSDVSGVVDAVGPGVTGFAEGDEVAGYVFAAGSTGAYAEMLVVSAHFVTKKPAGLGFEEAAAIPLAGLTAIQAVRRVPFLGSESVLVTGASGGTGSFVVPLVRHLGATSVLATATSEASSAYLFKQFGLGSEEVLRADRSTVSQLAGAIKNATRGGVHVAFDLVGGDMKKLAFESIRVGGHVVSIVEERSDPEIPIFSGRRSPLFSRSASFHYEFLGARALFGAPDDWRVYARGLEELFALVTSGVIPVPRVEVLGPLAVATVVAAHERLDAGHAQGKIVMTVKAR